MEKLKKMQFIDRKAIQSIDRLLLLFSLGYLYLYFQYGYTINLITTIFIIAIHSFNFLSKAQSNVLYASFGYSLVSFSILYHYYPNVAEMRFLFFIPFILFFVVLFSDFSSNLLTGFLLGYWILLLYFAFTSGTTGIQSILFSYANYHFVLEHILFLFMTAIIMYLFSKIYPYRQTTKTIKIAQLVVWIGIPFVLSVVNGANPAEEIKTAAIYLVLAIIMYRSLIQDKTMLASIAYAIVTFIVCTFVRQHFGIENFYFILLATLLVLLLVNYFKVNVRFLIGFVFSFWLIQLIILYQGFENGVLPTLEVIFSKAGILATMKYVWLPVIVGLLWSQKTSLIDSLINRLERINQNIKQRKMDPVEREPVRSKPVDPSTKGWEEL
ncbi:hypothetical protein E1I69_11490 [Bacillus timonensis]|uniref:Uncharacterized protein n=1 Tax=Bacillus timonensis TaxID=1033734 RepID=A0A4S3PRY1_9BACI|nr:hypothetical protein [Bacillus timonensis]THE12318.1 hypothetical protein E1I69_11490 [Bacillus timonensis]